MRFVRMPPTGEPMGLHGRASCGSARPTRGSVCRSPHPAKDPAIALARSYSFEDLPSAGHYPAPPLRLHVTLRPDLGRGVFLTIASMKNWVWAEWGLKAIVPQPPLSYNQAIRDLGECAM